MNKKLENACNLYMEGIRDGQAEKAIKSYTGYRYTQHSGGVKNGQEGFIEFFENFLKRNPIRDIKVLRSFVDGNFAFVHVGQSLNNGESKWVTMDMFDTDEDDKIIEHWDVICAHVETPSSVDMLEGPSEILDREKTEKNKRIVNDFLKTIFIEAKIELLPSYISDNCIQHSPLMQSGINGWKEYFESGIRYEFVFKVIGEGNFVTALSKCFDNDKEYAVFNLFRIEDGRIVEHWDSIEEIAPKEEWANCGKF